jgi:hypothetical protein
MRRGNAAELVRMASPLEKLSAKLDAFAQAHS